MDTNTALTVVGVTATVVFGIWATVHAVRYSGRVRILYVHDYALSLTQDITQNFPEMEVSFRGQPVSDNLVLLKGYFINTGKKDISPEMVEQKVTLQLPTDFEWIECKVVECSPAMKAGATIAERTAVVLDTGLWKTNEFLKVEALAAVPVVKADPDNLPKEGPAMRLRKALTFPHRIVGSRSIQRTRVPKPFRQVRTKRFCGMDVSLPIWPRTNRAFCVFHILLGVGLLGLGHFLPDGETVGELVAQKSGGLAIFGIASIALGVLMLVMSKLADVHENRILSVIAGKDEA